MIDVTMTSDVDPAGTLRVSLVGEHGPVAGARFAALLEQVYCAAFTVTVLDVRRFAGLDASAARALVQLQEEMSMAGCELHVVACEANLAALAAAGLDLRGPADRDDDVR